MSMLKKIAIVAGLVLCGWSVTAGETPLQKLDFTKGDTPGRFAKSYSLHLGQIAGIPNGVQKMGRDASQIYVSSITKGSEGTSLLQVGDVILGVNDKLFEGDVIETCVPLCVAPRSAARMETSGGHGSEERIPMIMSYLKTYGTAARVVIPELRFLLENCRNESFPADLNKKRTDAIEDAIASIEAAKDHPELMSLGK